MMSKRALGIDHGEKRIGLALSDPLRIIASPYGIWDNDVNFFERLRSLIKDKDIGTIVIGLPKNMDGSIGFQAKGVEAFFADFIVQEDQIEFIYWDERLSTRQAEESLKSQGLNQKKQKQKKDAHAASVILSEYLEFGG